MIYLWKCTTCDVHVEITRPVADCTVPPDADSACLCTVPEWKRVFEPPMQMRESYPDGMRRFNGVREASQLNREAVASNSQETKREIAAEIRKLGVRVNNGKLI